AVHTLVDDRPRGVQRVTRRLGAVRRARGQHDAGATLQVDAQFRNGLTVAGEEHQAVQADDDQQEDRQVASGSDGPGRWCHGSTTPPRRGCTTRRPEVAWCRIAAGCWSHLTPRGTETVLRAA